MGHITLPPDPALPNAIFHSPVYKPVHLIFLLASCSDHKRRRRKVMLELCFRLVGREQVVMKHIMDLHCLR
jgi:hypothetical protein